MSCARSECSRLLWLNKAKNGGGSMESSSKRKTVRLCVITALISVLVTLGLCSYLVISYTPIAKVYEVLRVLDQAYYKDFDKTSLMEGAPRGVVSALGDPYTTYMTKKEWTEFYITTSGEYSGVGITIGVKDGKVTVVAPMKGTPADKAGIKANDIILSVDGKDVATSDEAASLIRGPAGSEVSISVYRNGETLEFVLVRENIVIPAVNYEMKEGTIGYIELITFSENAAVETSNALKDLKAQGAQAIILDLRYNGGGLLDKCIDIANLFVPKGTVVTISGRKFEKTSFNSSGTGLGMPLFVLVNEGTASASEILAGAIQDYEVGTLIGKTTFGKGLVQNSYELSDGSYVKVTIAEYLTPKGRSIHGIGLEPDVIIEGDEEQLAKALELAKAEINRTF